MDVYLVDPTTNLIYNCVAVESIELARELYPRWGCYERTESNAYLNSTPTEVIVEEAEKIFAAEEAARILAEDTKILDATKIDSGIEVASAVYLIDPSVGDQYHD